MLIMIGGLAIHIQPVRAWKLVSGWQLVLPASLFCAVSTVAACWFNASVLCCAVQFYATGNVTMLPVS